MIYLISSLGNKHVPAFANALEAMTGEEVFTSWFGPGPDADRFWKKHEQDRGRNYEQALQHYAAQHIFEFDKFHILRSRAVVLLMPCGKSGFLELGWSRGKEKPGYIMLVPPHPLSWWGKLLNFLKTGSFTPEDKWDIMFQFASGVYSNFEDLVHALKDKGGEA